MKLFESSEEDLVRKKVTKCSDPITLLFNGETSNENHVTTTFTSDTDPLVHKTEQ